MIAILEQRQLEQRALDDTLLERMHVLLSEQIACAAGRARLQTERGRLGSHLRAGEFEFLREAALACGAGAEFDAETRALDALAKSYDPHSAYLSPAQLSALRAEFSQATGPEQRARGKIVERGGERIALVVMPSFYLLQSGQSSSADLRFILQRLASEQPKVLLLDLRGNGGGVIEEALRLTAALTGGGPVGYAVNSAGSQQLLRGANQAAAWSGPLVLLVDEGTASVSELVAAAIQDRGRGLVVGRRTHGKGTGQTLVLLSSPLGAAAGAVRVSDRFFYRLAGRALQREGVVPDVELRRTDAGMGQTERDRPGALRAGAVELHERVSVEALPEVMLQRLQADGGGDLEGEAWGIALEYARVLSTWGSEHR